MTLPAPAGLCESCRHALLRDTRRGTTYLRCGRAAWDERLVRYPPLPVLTCVGHDPGETPRRSQGERPVG